MTREKLADNIGAYIAAITMGCTNAEVTVAIMKDVDRLIAAKLAENAGRNLRTES